MDVARRLRTRVALVSLAFSFSVLSSGCFFRALIVSVGIQSGSYPYYEEEYTITIGTGTLVADCSFDTDSDFFGVGCLYVITDEDGFLVTITSTADLIADFGLFGAFIDPIVLQVPQSVTGASGTVKNGGVPVPLVITQVTSFKAGPNSTVTAEPGQKFLIIELPTAVANSVAATDPHEGRQLDFTLQLTSSDLPISVKSMFAVRVDAPGATYYLPMLPCTTSFTQVPAIPISFGSAQTAEDDVLGLLSTYEAMTCDGQVYDLRTTPGPIEPGAHTVFVPGLAFN